MKSRLDRLWDRWANLHPFLRFAVIAAGLALVAFAAVKPGYRAFKKWRLERNLAAAKEAVEAVRMDAARDFSLTVLRAGDPRIEAFRILETAMGSLRDPRHPDIARALMAHPEGSADDRLNGFRGVAPSLPMGVVAQCWASLPEADQRDPRFAVALADRLIAESRLTEAASLLVGIEPPDEAVRQRLVRLLVASGSAEALDEAQKRLAVEWPAEAAPGEWLDILASIPPASLRSERLAPVARALAKHAGEAPAALALARISYSADFAARARILDEAVGKWRDVAPLEVARFLRDLGLDRRLREVFPAGAVEAEPALLPLLADACERGEAWDELAALLDAEGQRLPVWEQNARRALVAHRTGNAPKFNEAWSAALEDAKSSASPEACLALHRYAARHGLAAEADRAMVEAVRRGRGPLPLYADLKPLLVSLARQNREHELIQICAIYLHFEPGNPVLLTQYAYLACLNDLAAPDVLLKAVAPLAEAYPEIAPIQCVLATLQLAAGSPAVAAEVLDRLDIDPDALAPGYRATWFVTQALAGRMTPDDPRLRNFPWNELLPSERRKFRSFLKLPEPAETSGR